MARFEDYFSVQVFLIVLRETLESAIIISVLLAFIKQTFKSESATDSTLAQVETTPQSTPDQVYQTTEVQSQKIDNDALYKYLRLQIWAGGVLGFLVCLIIGSVILSIFYILGSDLWAVTEHYWEGTFSIVASIIISVMGLKILRVNKMQENWKRKLASVLSKNNSIHKVVNSHNGMAIGAWSEKYAMFILPFVTTLREGMEAIVFIGGIGINEDTTIKSIFNSLVVALFLGGLIGVILYRSGNSLPLQWFLVVSTCFLYLVAAGLFSKGVWNFELQRFIDKCDGFDVSETGHGPGSYDIANSVWHVNCCNGELQDDGPFWMMFTAIFGWTNSATWGSVISYWIYWSVVILALNSLLFEERNGYLPGIPIAWQRRRIQKRQYAQITETATRESIDSVNSSTPLNSQ